MLEEKALDSVKSSLPNMKTIQLFAKNVLSLFVASMNWFEATKEARVSLSSLSAAVAT